jgi:hypothetical protein
VLLFKAGVGTFDKAVAELQFLYKVEDDIPSSAIFSHRLAHLQASLASTLNKN